MVAPFKLPRYPLVAGALGLELKPEYDDDAEKDADDDEDDDADSELI